MEHARFRILTTLLLSLALSATTAWAAPPTHSNTQLATDIFRQLIEIDTTHSTGSTGKAAHAMALRLRKAGFPSADLQEIGPKPSRGNLVFRWRGTGANKPLLLLAHLDVVEAKRSDWSLDPFVFSEHDGYYYGRGTTDDKAMAANWIATVITLKKQGFVPNRDIIVALTADEEGGEDNGVAWLLKNHKELIDAAFALNEGGDGWIRNGKRIANGVQLSEKKYLSFRLQTTNPGGHSSLPVKDNAIYHLALGLGRLSTHDFPARLGAGTRTFFERMGRLESGQTAADMRAITGAIPAADAVAHLSQSAYYNALMRTTCVPTMVTAGHAENALPQSAVAIVNCRLLPDESPEFVEQILNKVLADPNIVVSPMGEAKPSPASPMDPALFGPIERITEALWPGVPVVPTMVTGATDGLYLRNAGIPTYGVSGIFEDIDDIRAHGRDERILIQSFNDASEFQYRLLRQLASGD